MSAFARLLGDSTMRAADQYPLSVIPVIVGLAAFILKNRTLECWRAAEAAMPPGAFWGAFYPPEVSPQWAVFARALAWGPRGSRGFPPGMALPRRRSWLLGDGYVRRGWANWGRAGLRPRRSGPRMLEPGPSGIEGEQLCPSSAAYQGPRPVWARGCPGDTEPQACVGRWTRRLAEALGSGFLSQ